MLVLKRVGVAPIEEKMVQSRLSWFGHIVRRVQQLEGRGRGRPRKTKGKNRTRAVETAD
jgi:hypothetical protein